jgi:hypothetical protein
MSTPTAPEQPVAQLTSLTEKNTRPAVDETKGEEGATIVATVDTVETKTTTFSSSENAAEDKTHPSESDDNNAAGALWHSLRRFARGQFTHSAAESVTEEVAMSDYAALIEQDIANMSLSDSDDDMHFGTSGGSRKSGIG